METKVLARMSGTTGKHAATALITSTEKSVSRSTGLRPMLSLSAPTSGASRISISAETEATTDSSRVAPAQVAPRPGLGLREG